MCIFFCNIFGMPMLGLIALINFCSSGSFITLQQVNSKQTDHGIFFQQHSKRLCNLDILCLCLSMLFTLPTFENISTDYQIIVVYR